MCYRNRYFKIKHIKIQDVLTLKIHNHLPNSFMLGNKKALFYLLKEYYQKINKNVFDYVPLTFHIKNGIKD